MKEKLAKLDILKQTALPGILVFLKHKKRACRSELIRGVGFSQQATYNAVDKLLNYKLIKPITPEGSPRRKDVVLTDAGLRLAIELEKLFEVLP